MIDAPDWTEVGHALASDPGRSSEIIFPNIAIQEEELHLYHVIGVD
jgi:hypothetical protein